MQRTADICGLRRLVLNTASGSDARENVHVQALRSAKSALNTKQRKNESFIDYQERATNAFTTHHGNKHGWAVEQAVAEVIADRLSDDTYAKTTWHDDAPGASELGEILSLCVGRQQAHIFMAGLRAEHQGYYASCHNDFRKGIDNYPETVYEAAELFLGHTRESDAFPPPL